MNTGVYEINQFEDLLKLRGAWDRLLGETPGADFFRTFAWLETYWRHFQAGQRLRVMVVGRPSHPRGIVPLVVRSEATRLGKVRVLTWPLDGWGAFYGPVGADPAELLEAALVHVRAERRDWDLLELRWSPADPVLRQQTTEAMTYAGVPATVWEWGSSATANLAEGWDAYWNTRNAKRRSNVRRNEKKLNALGRLRYERYRPRGARYGDNDPRWDLYEACLQAASSSWQANSSSGTTLSHVQVRDFLHDAHQTAVDSGALDLNLIWLDERPIAFAYNYIWENRVFGLRQGFNGEFAAQGAGTVLMKRMLEDSAHRGDTEFDLGVDYLQGKRNWLSQVNPLLCYSHYAASPRAQGLRFKRWLEKSDPWARLLNPRCGAAPANDPARETSPS
ncbi:GNAT family N-acetyltransferase [Lignipirellula cremea]|uniref:BioF2-like acetyltransferase domain-containing protein n=1 Tax=Lignipirellula cremea TaxID=2528010 RepID=A0A518E220_9BACT|nr:GNAT family N-acetyltransferase [Lignipirellula cremea]QDU98140.1 hypothetical protein Pla8534_60010 [Lignipirellula cremea]